MADSSGSTSLTRCRAVKEHGSANAQFAGLARDVVESVALAGRRLDSAAGHALSVAQSHAAAGASGKALVAEGFGGVSAFKAFGWLAFVGSTERSVGLFCRNFRRQS